MEETSRKGQKSGTSSESTGHQATLRISLTRVSSLTVGPKSYWVKDFGGRVRLSSPRHLLENLTTGGLGFGSGGKGPEHYIWVCVGRGNPPGPRPVS